MDPFRFFWQDVATGCYDQLREVVVPPLPLFGSNASAFCRDFVFPLLPFHGSMARPSAVRLIHSITTFLLAGPPVHCFNNRFGVRSLVVVD